MLFKSEIMEERGVLDTAARMCVAARTAPKAKGRTLRKRGRTGMEGMQIMSVPAARLY